MITRVASLMVLLGASAGLTFGCAGPQIPWGPDDPRYSAGKFVTVDDKRIFYIDQGEGPVVVMLHGIPLSSWEWRRVIPVLSPDYRVIAPDLYGFGYSDRPLNGDYSWPAYGEWLSKFLDTLGVQRAVFVVTDIGGPIGFEFLSAHPERISGLVIANTWFTDEAFHVPFLLKVLRWPPTGWLGVYATNKPMVTMQARLLFGDASKIEGEFSEQVWMNVRTIHNRKVLQKIMRGFRIEHAEMFRNSLRAFQGPALVVWGDQDPVIPPRNVELFQVVLPHADIHHFPDAGHFIAQEKPTELAERILEFLDKHRPVL